MTETAANVNLNLLNPMSKSEGTVSNIGSKTKKRNERSPFIKVIFCMKLNALFMALLVFFTW